MPTIGITVVNIRAASFSAYRSLITARPTTMPAPAPIAWSRRPAPNTVTVGATAHSREAAMNTSCPVTMTRLRP